MDLQRLSKQLLGVESFCNLGTDLQLVKNLPAFYRTSKLIFVVKKAASEISARFPAKIRHVLLSLSLSLLHLSHPL